MNQHGEITRAGDEYNHDDMAYCAKCGRSHSLAYKGCDGLRGGWPPPFPTGVVPRLNPATLRPYAPDHPVDGTRTLPDFGVHGAAIQQAVDDYLLMERKARAWDELVRGTAGTAAQPTVDDIWAAVHPAPTSSTR